MSPIQKPMAEAPLPSAAPRPAAKKPNLWLVISIVLAIALIGVVFTNYFGKQDQTQMTVLVPDTAGQTLLDFINEVYAGQIGTATLKGVTVESGLYQVTVSIIDPQTNQPVDQTVFLTRDGKYFVPQIVEISAVLNQFRTLQQQPPPQIPATGEPAPDANTNAAPTDQNPPAAE